MTTLLLKHYGWIVILAIGLGLAGARVIIKVSGHQYQWLGPGNRTFLEVASMDVTWWIVAFCAVSVTLSGNQVKAKMFLQPFPCIDLSVWVTTCKYSGHFFIVIIS